MTVLEMDFIGAVFAVIFLAAGACIKSWRRFLRREGKSTRPHVYRCPHIVAHEFSGGYRDLAVPNVRCTYQLKFHSIMHPLAGTWRARCPTHHCFLVKV